MADLQRYKRRRKGYTTSVSKLIKRIEERLLVEDTSKDQIQIELVALKNTLKEKENTIKELDNNVLDEISDEEEIVAEIENSTTFEVMIKSVEERIKRALHTPPIQSNESTLSVLSESRTNVKLPKLSLKKFNGEATEWTSFYQTFMSAVDNNEGLSKVEKFTYLKGFVEKDPAKTSEIVNRNLQKI